jgi:hypothetical protein
MKSAICAIFMLMTVGPTVGLAAGDPVMNTTIDSMGRYTSTVTGTGVGSNVTVALTVPAGSLKRAFLEDIVVTAPTSGTLTLGYGATAPTAGALSKPATGAIANANYVYRNTSTAPTAVIYGPATGQGAPLFSVAYPISANVPQPYNMRGTVLSSGLTTTRTILVTLSAPTGGYQFVIIWGEK